MKASKREDARQRIDISLNSMAIIEDMIERGYFENPRQLIEAALPLLQIKLVNETQHVAEQDGYEEAIREMTDLQLKDVAE